MLKRYKLIVLPLIVLTLIVFSVVGCGLNPEKPTPEENGDNTPEVPETLTELEGTILETMYAIDSVRGVEESLAEIEKLKMEITEESEVDQDQEEKEESAMDMIDFNRLIMENSILISILEEEEVEGDEMVDPANPPKEIDEVWFNIQKNLYDIHLKWNVLERHLQDVKVSKSEMEEFEELLEDLTDHIDNEDVEASLDTSNELLGKLAEFRNHFKADVPYEIYKLRYHTRKAVLLAHQEEYDSAFGETDKGKELLNGLRQRVMEKDSEADLQKFELSLEDLQHEIESENFHLVQIKSAIVMKNIELLQTPFEAGG